MGVETLLTTRNLSSSQNAPLAELFRGVSHIPSAWNRRTGAIRTMISVADLSSEKFERSAVFAFYAREVKALRVTTDI